MSEQKFEHHVGHHFDSAEQEFSANKFGFWLFLATEILLFGGLFVAYVVFRVREPEMFMDAHLHLNRTMGAINTLVLITSSFTMAMAVRAAQTNKHKLQIWLMLATIGFAVTFMVIKYFEYKEKIAHGYLPGFLYTPHGDDPINGNLFFGLYFMMTGLHGLHVVIGIIAITWVLNKSRRRMFSSSWYTPVELVGLYWHLVDLIWIFLFPLFYLIG